MPTDYSGLTRRQLLAGTAGGVTFLTMPSIVRAQAPSLKIAVLLPQSGYLAQAGQSCHRGALVASSVLREA
jgi:branched-chain amino acid transport system substrate-binding protein